MLRPAFTIAWSRTVHRSIMSPKSGTKPSSNSFAALSQSNDILEEATMCKSSRVSSTSASTSSAADTQHKSLKPLQDPIVWVDLEMTGLDLEKHTIIEIAVIITDGELNRVIEGPATAIHASDKVLETMNEWCIEHHGKSGLTQRVKDSTVDMAEAQRLVLDFVRLHIPDANAGVLAGNSIHVDRSFLVKHMPELISHLHYRIIDVSTIKELAKRWFPKECKNAPRKRLEHTALSDIRESVEELKYWRQAVFKNNGKGTTKR